MVLTGASLSFFPVNVIESIKVAFRSIRANLLRTVLTLLIISVGIACLVGILTAIDTILYSLSSNFNRIGANSFNIYPGQGDIRSNSRGRQRKKAEEISFKQALDFKDRFEYAGSAVSLNMFGTRNATIKYKGEKTNPTIRVVGIDENYLDVSAYEIEVGRNFTEVEVSSGHKKVILANGIIKLLFNEKPETAVGKIVSIGSNKYKVVGVCKSKGSSMNSSGENRVFIPLVNSRMVYGSSDTNYGIVGAVSNSLQMDDAVSAAIGTMRNVRRLKASEENNFHIRKSDGILQTLKGVTTELRISTIIIAFLTLLSASIGLMNIMLVSVTERTKEIGVRKALGATRFNVLFQFLTEAVIICLLGGFLGIILGILFGVVVSIFIEGQFELPIAWMLVGIVVSIFVGVASGLYPALKASRLDPIESLRYE